MPLHWKKTINILSSCWDLFVDICLTLCSILQYLVLIATPRYADVGNDGRHWKREGYLEKKEIHQNSQQIWSL